MQQTLESNVPHGYFGTARASRPFSTANLALACVVLERDLPRVCKCNGLGIFSGTLCPAPVGWDRAGARTVSPGHSHT